jgi:hypothetical protein
VTGWDVATWLAIAVLGPGAVVIFTAFVRDLLRPGRPDEDPGAPLSRRPGN